MIPAARRMASPSTVAAAIIVFLSASELPPVAFAQNSRAQCVRQARSQLRSYVKCVYGLDDKDRDKQKDRMKECELGQQRETAARSAPKEEREERTKEPKELKKVSKDMLKGAKKVGKDMKEPTKVSEDRKSGKDQDDNTDTPDDNMGGMDDHEIRQLRPVRRTLQKGKKEEAEVAATQNCLENFGEDVADATVELCLLWDYDLSSCLRMCYVTTKLKDVELEASTAKGKSGWRCSISSVCNEGLFCATECFNGIGCPEEMTVGNGYCQPCNQCEVDNDVFVAGPPQDGAGCSSVCQQGRNQILRSISGDENLSMFMELVHTIDLDWDQDPEENGYQWYQHNQQITLFVPENKAIDRIGRDYRETFEKYLGNTTLWAPQLIDILKFHTLPDSKYSSTDIAGMVGSDGILSLNEVDTLNFEEKKNEIQVNGAKILQANIEAGNSIAHVIDELLFPQSATSDLLEMINMKTELSALAALLADLSNDARDIVDEMFSNDGPLTFFAPSNGALDALDTTSLESEADISELLVDLIKSHTVQLNVHSSRISGNAVTVDTLLEGESLKVKTLANDKGVMVMRDSVQASVVSPNRIASNGIMHVIDVVLFPMSIIGPI